MGHNLFSVSVILLLVLSFVTMPIASSHELSGAAYNRFAVDLYQKCATESMDKNVIISPFSVTTSLALLSQGAQGTTFDQIAHGLHLEANKMAVANGFVASHNLLSENVGQSTFSIANQLYLHKGYHIQQTFRDVAVNKFKSGVENIDFANSSAAAKTINSFVEQKTNNKIKDLFNSDSFDADSRFVLVNAIYFKGTWEEKFSTQNTAPGNFYVDEVNTVTVDFMQNTGDYLYGQLTDLNASAVELRYVNSNISLVVALPDSRTGLSALEASLVNYNISEMTIQMFESVVDIKLPKFKTEYQIELTQVLQKLGMVNMFENSADFGGLLDSSEPLKVSEVVHKAFIEINEEGSEAAASTVFRLIPLSADYEDPLPQEFYADHPFLYFIMDRNTNTILFTGRYKKFD